MEKSNCSQTNNMNYLKILPFWDENNNDLHSIYHNGPNSVSGSSHRSLSSSDYVYNSGIVQFFTDHYTSYDLIVLHVNIRSIIKNFDKLEELIYQMPAQPDFIFITETKLKQTSPINLISLPGYGFYNKNSLSRAGGVGFYVKEDIKFVTRSDLNLFGKEFESLWIETQSLVDKKPVVLGVVYRHPSHNIKLFTEELNTLLLKLSVEGKTVFVTGDLNIDFLKIKSNQIIENYNNMLLSYNFENLIKSPTRMTEKSSTLIDHFYNNNDNIDIKTAIMVDDLSDHFPILAVVKNSRQRVKKQVIYARNFSNINYNKVKQDAVVMVNKFNELSSNSNSFMDITEKFELLQQGIVEIINANIPIRKLTRREVRSQGKPWLTKGILKSVKTKNYLYKKLCKTNFKNQDLYDRYRQYRNKLTYLKQQSKSNYYHKVLQSSKGDIKKTWRTINGIIKKGNKRPCLPSKLIIHKENLLESEQIANKLNHHFSTIGKHSTDEVDYHQVIKTIPWQSQSIHFKPTTAVEIHNIISNLNSRKASGADEISVYVLKELRDLLSPIMSNLINECFQKGTYPDCLKLAIVIPLHKGGAETDPNNFRPISILPTLNKVMEKVIHTRLYDYFEKYKIINDNQFGFRRGHSTTMAVTEFVENILNSYDKQQATCAIFVDLSKAFDSVNRNILLLKLYRYGVRGSMHDLLTSYLDQRKQFIKCDGVSSSQLSVDVGVPQGSILGPLLFLIHLNDLKYSTNLQTINFADDTLLYQTIDNTEGVQEKLTHEMKKVKSWMNVNHLRLNASKTKFMVFHPKKYKYKKLTNLKLKLDSDNEIEQVKQFKYLGLIIDQDLSWKSHIKYITTKLSRTLGLLYKTRHFMDKKCRLLLFNSLFLSYIQYGIICWGRAKITAKKPISILYNKALRCINFSDFRDSSTPLYIHYNLLKLDDIFNLEICKFMFKWSKGTLPTIFNKYFVHINTIHNYQTRTSRQNFYISKKLTRTGMCTLNYLGARLWREVPNALKEKSFCATFSYHMKRHLLNQYALLV